MFFVRSRITYAPSHYSVTLSLWSDGLKPDENHAVFGFHAVVGLLLCSHLLFILFLSTKHVATLRAYIKKAFISSRGVCFSFFTWRFSGFVTIAEEKMVSNLQRSGSLHF